MLITPPIIPYLFLLTIFFPIYLHPSISFISDSRGSTHESVAHLLAWHWVQLLVNSSISWRQCRPPNSCESMEWRWYQMECLTCWGSLHFKGWLWINSREGSWLSNSGDSRDKHKGNLIGDAERPSQKLKDWIDTYGSFKFWIWSQTRYLRTERHGGFYTKQGEP